METEADDYHYWKGTEGMAEEQVLVFTYGTLKRGKGNNTRFLSSSVHVREAHTVDKFMLFNVGFPLCRLPNPDDRVYYQARVKGEVYRVNKATLARLDGLEGHPDFYERRITNIEGMEGEKVWMYHWAEAGGSVDGGVRAPVGRTPDNKEAVHDWQY